MTFDGNPIESTKVWSSCLSTTKLVLWSACAKTTSLIPCKLLVNRIAYYRNSLSWEYNLLMGPLFMTVKLQLTNGKTPHTAPSFSTKNTSAIIQRTLPPPTVSIVGMGLWMIPEYCSISWICSG